MKRKESTTDQIRKRMIRIFVMVILISVALASRSYPGYKVSRYIHAINQEDYETVYHLTYQDEQMEAMSKEAYITLLAKYFSNPTFIKAKKGEQLQDGQAYYVDYVFAKETVHRTLGLKKVENTWYIENPFYQLNQVEKSVEKEEANASGEYQLQGVSGASGEIGINDEVGANGEVGINGAEESIEEKKKTYAVDENAVIPFMDTFYQDYARGIQEQVHTYISPYIQGENKEDILDVYEAWYIKDKHAKDISMQVELSNIECLEGETLIGEQTPIYQLHTLEVVTFLDEGEGKGVWYKVVTGWEVSLGEEEGALKIIEKRLDESVVSYKDAQGEWIAY